MGAGRLGEPDASAQGLREIREGKEREMNRLILMCGLVAMAGCTTLERHFEQYLPEVGMKLLKEVLFKHIMELLEVMK
jgi:hypothetical protein